MFHRITEAAAARARRRTAALLATLVAGLATAAPATASQPTAGVARTAAVAPAVGGWSNVKWSVLDDRAKKLVYSGGWTQYDNLSPQQSGTATSTRTAGSTVSVTCTCTAFRFDSVKSPDLGSTEVRVDGTLIATPTATAATKATASTVVWRSNTMLPYGQHTLTLTSHSGWTEIDAIGIGVYQDPDCPGVVGEAASSSIENYGWALKKVHDNETAPNKLGWHSDIVSSATPKSLVCVQIDNGAVIGMNSVTLYPAHPDGFAADRSFGFPKVLRVQVANQPDFSDGQEMALHSEGATEQATLIDAPRIVSFGKAVAGRYVRVIADELGPITPTTYAFALAEIQSTTMIAPNFVNQWFDANLNVPFSATLNSGAAYPAPTWSMSTANRNLLAHYGVTLSASGVVSGTPINPDNETEDLYMEVLVTATNSVGTHSAYMAVFVRLM
jgi:hypothetical protein